MTTKDRPKEVDMYQFTAARAEQHRADLMAAAARTRGLRTKKTWRSRVPRGRVTPSPAIKLASQPSS
jgi:hypothetical protein